MNWMLMPLRRYADFRGRSRRMEFWMWQLFLFLVNLAFMILFFILVGSAMFGAFASNPQVLDGGTTGADDAAALAAIGSVGVGAIILWSLNILWGLATLIPNLAVAVRRLHDIDRTGWWIAAPILPYILLLVLIGVSAGMGGNGGAAVAGIGALLCGLAVLGLAITLLVFFFLEGTRGPNRFGPDPKAGADGYQQTFA